jgi:hypothetical protein
LPFFASAGGLAYGDLYKNRPSRRFKKAESVDTHHTEKQTSVYYFLQATICTISPTATLLQPRPLSLVLLIIMCHGHPRYHSCAHTSMVWYYCPSASIDLQTGYEAPCRNVTLAPSQASRTSCPLSVCYFKEKGGQWTCCQCKQGPNLQGWCTMPLGLSNGDVNLSSQLQMTCDHGCCKSCKKSGMDSSIFVLYVNAGLINTQIDVKVKPYEQETSWLSDAQYQSGLASPASSESSRAWSMSDGSLSASPTSSKASSVYGSYEDCSRTLRKGKSSGKRR